MRKGSRCGIVLDEGVLFRVDGEAFVKTKRKLLEECDVYCIVSLPGGVFSSAGAGVKTNLVFFTKGQQTERIWYHDLSDVKVGKKTPLMLRHFDEFFRLLPKRTDSAQSWTLDFSSRLQAAMEEARPFREQAAALKATATGQEEEWRAKRKDKTVLVAEITALEERWKQTLRTARETEAKAESIECAAYDLKAVNPNRSNTEDKRTPTQLLAVIEAKGSEAEESLQRLKLLVAASAPAS
jgi:type I restriction enzyme M protein